MLVKPKARHVANMSLAMFLACLDAACVASQEDDHLVATIPEGLEAGMVTFSHDGRVAAYGAKHNNEMWIVAGDWKSTTYQFASYPILRRGGKDVFFHARKTGGASSVFLNDSLLFESTKEWSWTLPGAVSADGKIVASRVQHSDSKKSAIAINGKIGMIYAGFASVPVLSGDGKVIAFALEREEDHCIVVNDVSGPAFDWVTQPVLSADGTTVAYGAETRNEHFLLYGDRKTAAKKSPVGIFLSLDGKAIGYWRSVKTTDQKLHQQVIVGDKEGPMFHSIESPTFSPDAKHIAYRATGDNGISYLVINDQKHEAGGIQTGPMFLGDGRVGYGARNGRELWWKVINVK